MSGHAGIEAELTARLVALCWGVGGARGDDVPESGYGGCLHHDPSDPASTVEVELLRSLRGTPRRDDTGVISGDGEEIGSG